MYKKQYIEVGNLLEVKHSKDLLIVIEIKEEIIDFEIYNGEDSSYISETTIVFDIKRNKYITLESSHLNEDNITVLG